MPWTKTEVKQFFKELLEAGAISNEKAAALDSVIEEISTKDTALDYLDKNQLRQQRFSQEMANVQELKSKAEEATSKANSLQSLIDELKSRPHPDAQKIAGLEQRVAFLTNAANTLYGELAEYDDGKDILKKAGLETRDSIYGGTTINNNNNNNNRQQQPLNNASPSNFDPDAFKKSIIQELMGQINPSFTAVAEFAADVPYMLEQLRSFGLNVNSQQLKTTLGQKMNELKTSDYMAAFNAAYEIPKLELQRTINEAIAANDKKWEDKLIQQQASAALGNGQQNAEEIQTSGFFNNLTAGNEKVNGTSNEPPPLDSNAGMTNYYQEAAAALAEVRKN